MTRFHPLRALLAGVAAVLAAAATLYAIAPVFGLPRLDVVGWLAREVAGVPAGDTARAGAAGWALALAAGLGLALLFALLWDAIPPRTRPISKALVFVGLVVAIARPPLAALPAALAFALALGLAYRPHATAGTVLGN